MGNIAFHRKRQDVRPDVASYGWLGILCARATGTRVAETPEGPVYALPEHARPSIYHETANPLGEIQPIAAVIAQNRDRSVRDQLAREAQANKGRHGGVEAGR